MKSWFVSPAVSTAAAQTKTENGRPHLTALNNLLHRLAAYLPPLFRETAAEFLLRRAATPGPAIEHAVQYRLSMAKAGRKPGRNAEATVAAGADRFYEKQYRQFLNPTMGAFAVTATQALLACGGPGPIPGWRNFRRCHAALVAQTGNIPPIWVLNRQTVALPLLLPRLPDQSESSAVNPWLAGSGDLPLHYKQMIRGMATPCYHPMVQARLRSADGSLLEVMDSLRHTGKLAVLALHPHDPDAMGLHMTLFGANFLNPVQLAAEYGLSPKAINAHLQTAEQLQRRLVYCVGGTEEVFTQCSQNLFTKIAVEEGQQHAAGAAQAWTPALPLAALIGKQFEMIQVTVSSSGLPGASPRNGDQGKAAFMAHRRLKPVLLIPYHPGNAVHGHAAKLWSNPYASIVVSDDHTNLCRVVICGAARVLTHHQVKRQFPAAAEAVAAQTGRHGVPIADPEYWFLQEADELIQEQETLTANRLTPGRATCTISAGGMALHNKKPAYFAADSLPAYDQALQHRRERSGRPKDPKGLVHRHWLKELGPSLQARLDHLRNI